MKILDIDSPLMQALSKMADLMWLNILTIVCCVPVITIGPALTAMNYMALKIVRHEECYITKGYFKAFKENFLQSVVIWILFLLAGIVMVEDYYISTRIESSYGGFLQIVLMMVSVVMLLTFMFVFPVQAKFANPIRRTLKNALLISVMQFPKTILMIMMYLFPYVLIFLSMTLFPTLLLFGISVPAFLSAKMYDKFFQRLEDQILEKNAQENPVEQAEGEEPIFQEMEETDPEVGQNSQK